MTSDEKFTALALLYGPPKPEWEWWTTHGSAGFGVPDDLIKAALHIFDSEEVLRVGKRRFAQDYAYWYKVGVELRFYDG